MKEEMIQTTGVRERELQSALAKLTQEFEDLQKQSQAIQTDLDAQLHSLKLISEAERSQAADRERRLKEITEIELKVKDAVIA